MQAVAIWSLRKANFLTIPISGANIRPEFPVQGATLVCTLPIRLFDRPVECRFPDNFKIVATAVSVCTRPRFCPVQSLAIQNGPRAAEDVPAESRIDGPHSAPAWGNSSIWGPIGLSPGPSKTL